jgi:alpha-methylacyl-CoA racemase
MLQSSASKHAGDDVGPLSGLKIVELAGLGAGPFAAMMFADMGAEVVRVDRVSNPGLGIEIDTRYDLMLRGRRSIAIDLKTETGRETVLKLAEQADVLIESFRPGVTERLGLGPEDCMRRNPRLVYGRMTGWGQEGPYAAMAGHDINYIALAGVLDTLGSQDGPPMPPLNLIGDFGGAALFSYGVMCAVWEAARSGKGQVVDGAMVDAAAYLMTMIHGFRHAGLWSPDRGDNVVDGGAPFYRAYRTADDKYIAIGPIEEKFYDELLKQLGLHNDSVMKPQTDKALWPLQRLKLEEAIARRTRQEWCEILENTDTCFAPVLSMAEVDEHPHLRERSTFIEIDGLTQPAPAPRFSRSSSAIPTPPPPRGAHSEAILSDWGFSEAAVRNLIASGAVVQA